MINVYNVKLMDLVPSNLRQDPDLIAAAASLDIQYSKTVNDVKKCILLPRASELNDEELDLLAWQEHVDFYDASLPIEQKRELVSKATYFHEIKATPTSVEDLITTLFGEGKVVEWFEYDGIPYHFKVVTNNQSVTNEKANEFIRALESVKRLSAVLDKVELTQTDEMNLYFAGVMQTGDKMVIRQVN